MNLASLRAHCLAKPGATEGRPFGPEALVMKVGGKIFAIIGDDAEPLTLSLKCEPEVAVLLRQSHEAVGPGYHLNKRHWNTVTLDDTVAVDDVLEWVDDSYDLVVDGLPRRVREALRAAGQWDPKLSDRLWRRPCR
ncbi:MAG: MmcQ/YjbR family DNA-binding protein [Actinomycetota bacterium]|nr:MmcQ/YjbR family DNA-binding protein [Actinomycetota bacterium]